MTNRHIRKIASTRHIPAVLRLLSVVAIAAFSLFARSQEPAIPQDGIPAATTEAAPPPFEPAEVTSVAEANAATLLEESRETLAGYRTLKAHMSETVEFGPRRLKAEGQYVQGAGNKVRIDLQVAVGENKGSLLQVSAGDVLWTVYGTGSTPRITRRDVKQILAAAKTDQVKSTVAAELGLGGLPALLAAIEQTIEFETPMKTNIEGREFFVLEGTWKAPIADQFQKQAQQYPSPTTETRPLPAPIPDLVRLYLDAETKFPSRSRYLKRSASPGEAPAPVLTIDFRDIVVNASLDPSEFRYTAPKDAQVNDITKMYLQQLQGGQPAAPAAPPVVPPK
jgi:outer membrane lipoprotein-sorting protein